MSHLPSKERMPHWTCKTHGDFDARVAVGCPDCVRQMRDELQNLRRENVRWENAHKILLAENDRLRKQVGELSIHAEKWVKRALGGAAPEPPAALGWRDAVAISTGEKTVIATNRSAQHPSPALAHCAHTLAALCKQHDLYFSDATYRGCVDTVLMLTEGHAQPPRDGQ